MGGIAASAKLELEGKVHKSRGKAQSSTSTLDDVEKVKKKTLCTTVSSHSRHRREAARGEKIAIGNHEDQREQSAPVGGGASLRFVPLPPPRQHRQNNPTNPHYYIFPWFDRACVSVSTVCWEWRGYLFLAKGTPAPFSGAQSLIKPARIHGLA